MPDTVSDVARRLAENAEAVCRHYLSNGRRAGGYWLAGDVQNSPGRSLYVRLRGPTGGRGAAGKWTDSATGERGDLLDLIAATQASRSMGDALDEARRFLGMARPIQSTFSPAPSGSPDAAQRLFAMAKPIAGTLAESYLRTRGIEGLGETTALRFHPHCFYRADAGPEAGYAEAGCAEAGSAEAGSAEAGSAGAARAAWPALIAAVTDAYGRITGLQRTYLDPSGIGKAPVTTPRRAMGNLLGHAVRFGCIEPAPAKAAVMAAGEGIETVLSLRRALPLLPLAAALSAGHLAALKLPAGLRRLYIAHDRDRAGAAAAERLAARATAAGIEAIGLQPRDGDFNDDLCQHGPAALAAALRVQLAAEDVTLFWRTPACGGRAR